MCPCLSPPCFKAERLPYSDLVLAQAVLSRHFPGWGRDEIMALSTRERLNYLAAAKYLEGR